MATTQTPSVNDPDFEKKRWVDLDKLLLRTGPFVHPAFTPGEEVKEFLQTKCRVLVVGAGGLGCDLVKNLALSGFRNIDIIDMDTIDTSNLNRQFLFRDHDVGNSKSITAANFINKRVFGAKVTAHHGSIQDKGLEFYKEFQIVICGLDSIEARRWMNSTLFDFVKFEGEGDQKQVDWSTVVPYIDGGTEGFKGQARVIFPGVTACFECTMDLFTEDENYPLCTIKNKPRLPEHCIQYAMLVLWKNKTGKPGIADDESIDRDNPKHVKWIFDAATERASQFNIRGVTYRLTQHVIKRIIPAIASTNAIIASACTNEALKLATLMASPLDDYMFYNGNEGIFTYKFKYEKKESCPVCGQPSLTIKFSKHASLNALRAHFTKNPALKLRNPTIRHIAGSYLYAATPKQLEAMTAPNLEKKLHELIEDGDVLLVTDRLVISSEFRVTVKLTDEPFVEASAE